MDQCPPPPRPGLTAIFREFLALGLTAFGGPAMVPYIRAMAVDKRGWLSDELFRMGMALCQAIPGATAMQVAAYVGLRTRGLSGALAAYVGFGLPAFVLITLLSHLYVTSRDLALVATTFTGLKVVVVALVSHAALNFASRYLERGADKALALLAGLIFGLRGNPILAIVGVCLLGLVLYRNVPGGKAMDCQDRSGPWARLALLAVPCAATLGLLWALAPQLFAIAWVMFKVDLFAFGGGYVSLPLMLHEVTDVRGWMDAATLMDGIALGQVTPGPIVITAAFVGYLLAGYVGAFVGAVFAFTPSFIILVGVTPYYDRLQASPLFQRLVRASLASLVGLMAAMAARFAVAAPWSPLGGLVAGSALLALRMGAGLLPVVLASALASMILL